MAIAVEEHWITGEELGGERQRLLKAGYDDDSPEMERLWQRVRQRDEYLWSRYAVPLIESNRDKWAAVSLRGEVLLRDTASGAISDATRLFGAGNFAYGRLADFPGHDLCRC